MSANTKSRETTVKLRNLTAALAKFLGFHMSSSILSISSIVGEIEYPYQHHDALYDDIISTHPFKFSLANQKA